MRVSWVGVQGATKADVLEALQFSDTGESCEAEFVGPFAAAEADGWVFVVADTAWWAEDDLIADLSKLGFVLGMQLSETVMHCGLTAARDGTVLWRVIRSPEHEDPDIADQDLYVEGEPPASLTAIKAALDAQAEANDQDVDYVFDAPLELAKAICGFRIDQVRPQDFSFTRLEGGPPEDVRPQSAGGGLFGLIARLFGR
jgi:hypothetical protein